MNSISMLSRCSFIQNSLNISRSYSILDRNKKYYQLTIDEDEQPPKPNPNADIERKIEESKEKLHWRAPYAENLSFFTFGLGLYKSDSDKSLRMQELSKPLDWSFDNLKKKHQQKMRSFEILSQAFIQDRHRILGNDLAAAHFIVARGGKVR